MQGVGRFVVSARRVWTMAQMMRRSETLRSRELTLYFDPSLWAAGEAREMLEIGRSSSARLARFFDRPWPDGVACFVTDEATARQIQDVEGAAYSSMTIIGVPRGQLSQFALTVTHELAHILANGIGAYERRFKGEGFACFATWALDPYAVPCGLPLHYHLAWALTNGIAAPLETLWARQDYTPEIYDFAWSFAALCAERYGTRGYLRFYSLKEGGIRQRLHDAFGENMERVEREWHTLALQRVPQAAGSALPRRRWSGTLCARAAWLSRRRESR